MEEKIVLREAIATGDTIEAAFKNALEMLGAENAEMEVIDEPEKKILGLFGGKEARVRAYILPTPGENAADYLKVVLEKMGVGNVKIDIKEEESAAELTIDGDDIGFIIGHRGETLDSLQYLASLVANQTRDKYFRLTLDVGSFREKRKETLENLGTKMAMRAIRTGRNQPLEPMNPYERRIIHTAVQNIEGAKSWSEGEDMARHVVIGPENGERRDRNRRRGKDGYNNQKRERNFEKKADTRPAPKAPQKISGPAPLDPNRVTKKIEDAPLYGRIERSK